MIDAGARLRTRIGEKIARWMEGPPRREVDAVGFDIFRAETETIYRCLQCAGQMPAAAIGAPSERRAIGLVAVMAPPAGWILLPFGTTPEDVNRRLELHRVRCAAIWGGAR